MPSHKQQHFVPRCHLRPFSLNGKGDAINLFNINREQAIRAASVKWQCARGYFYGEDGKLEKILQSFEGRYATIVRAIRAGSAIQQDDLTQMRDFMFLQSRRTEIAAQRIK